MADSTVQKYFFFSLMPLNITFFNSFNTIIGNTFLFKELLIIIHPPVLTSINEIKVLLLLVNFRILVFQKFF